MYPYWWDKTITIYNKTTASTGRVSYKRTVLSGCFWKYINNVQYVNNVKMQTKEVICRIPKQENYVTYEDWLELETIDTEFTLRNGDIIILGEVTDEVDEYTKGSHATDLLSKYKEVNRAIQIESFTDDTGDGLCCEHYNIKGI